MIPVASKRRTRFILPLLYVALAAFTWLDFVRTNHDGLANVWLFAVTLPVTLIDLALGAALGRGSLLMPHGHGYLTDHALYYVPAVAAIAYSLWLLGRFIDRRR